MRNIDMEIVISEYIETALWLETDNSDESGGEPFNVNYSVDDINGESRDKMASDMQAFVDGCIEHRPDVFGGIEDRMIGRDFWLTRCGHGVGFWDRGLGEIGDWLTSMAKPYGDASLYLGDDEKIHYFNS